MFHSYSFKERLFTAAAYWAVYGSAIAIYSWSSYYQGFLRISMPGPAGNFSLQQIFLALLAAFTLSIFLTKRQRPFRETRICLTVRACRTVFRGLSRPGIPIILPEEEKTSLLLLGVKFFFTPIMAKFLAGNAAHAVSGWEKISAAGWELSAEAVLSLYPWLIGLLLIIDTGYFLVGYIVESPRLGNAVRSVDATASGWIVALICYPPFNQVTAGLFGSIYDTPGDFGVMSVNLAVGAFAVACMAAYVWATVALGLKASNLTNRGIVDRGPYRFVRHPAYATKNLAWWAMGLPTIIIPAAYLFSIPVSAVSFEIVMKVFAAIVAPLATLVIWSAIYYARALTEERHLMRDPEYRAYAERVKWRFFPGWF